jgi:hypothetical protein
MRSFITVNRAGRRWLTDEQDMRLSKKREVRHQLAAAVGAVRKELGEEVDRAGILDPQAFRDFHQGLNSAGAN